MLWPPPTAVRPRDPFPSAFPSVKWAQSPARGHSAPALTCAVPWGRRGDPGPPPGPRLATEGGGRPAHPARSEALGGVCQESEPGLWGRGLGLGLGEGRGGPALHARPGAVPCNLQTTPTRWTGAEVRPGAGALGETKYPAGQGSRLSGKCCYSGGLHAWLPLPNTLPPSLPVLASTPSVVFPCASVFLFFEQDFAFSGCRIRPVPKGKQQNASLARPSRTPLTPRVLCGPSLLSLSLTGPGRLRHPEVWVPLLSSVLTEGPPAGGNRIESPGVCLQGPPHLEASLLLASPSHPAPLAAGPEL